MAEERRVDPAEIPSFGPPSEPRPAASIVLLRRGGKHVQRALEVLMLKRSAEARFMPSVWVFPGGSVDPADGAGEAGRRACAVRELGEEAGIELPADEELVLFSRWITPAVVATRFDARFYLALAPAHTPPRPDGSETVEARWFEPAAALAAADSGEIDLAFPTISQLGRLAEHATADAAIAAYRTATVEPILPVVVGTRDDARVLLPDDPDYPR
ncbi:MAG: NUDIX hydrolase [Actinobacteria bacterium]|nr:NUDIX hydrolase [Actinomycetota bacterium]